MKTKERIVFIDYIRVIACFMVMLVHASENFYGTDTADGLASNMSMLANESNRFWVAFYDGGLARVSVPLFMIVSAFLLVPMPKGQTMPAFYRRRFMRIIPPFVCFLLLYTFLPLLWGGMTWEQSMADLRMLPFNFPSMAGHLWFMYPLISLYLIIPVVSPWLERSSARDERIFLTIFVVSTFIPWLHRFVSPEIWGECFWNQFSMLWYCSGYLGYLVLAHYIRVHLAHWSVTKRLRVGLPCFIVGAAFTAWSFWWKGEPGQLIETPMLEWSWEFCTPNVLLATFGIFLIFSCIRQPKAPAIIGALSRLSFGMYLMHMFFLAPIASFIVAGNVAAPQLPVWLAIPVIAMLTFLCSAITTKLLSFLPGSKYLVG
ncbi:MAG: acyltransferase [Prevotella sp.]|nr:acyltransferase [Prevotella sp.]